MSEVQYPCRGLRRGGPAVLVRAHLVQFLKRKTYLQMLNSETVSSYQHGCHVCTFKEAVSEQDLERGIVHSTLHTVCTNGDRGAHGDRPLLRERNTLTLTELQGYLAHKNPNLPPGPPYGPRQSPTVGS